MRTSLYRSAPSLAPTRLIAAISELSTPQRVAAAARRDGPATLDSPVAHAESNVVEVDDDADVVGNDPHALAHAGAPGGRPEV